MSDECEILFLLLMDGNFAEWQVCIEADLIDQDLWEYMFGDEKAPEGDMTKVKKELADYQMKLRQARARMIKQVMASQLSHMMDPDPKVVWAELVHVHHAGGFGLKLAMRRRRFLNARMQEGEAMASWVLRVKALVFELRVIKAAPTDEDVILMLTNRLPTTYQVLVIALDSTPTTDITLPNVISRLTNEEGCQDSVQIEEEPHDAGDAMVATAGHHDQLQVTCFQCRKNGHYIRKTQHFLIRLNPL